MFEEVQRALEGRPRDARFVVLSDFDGTLAEFHADPAAPVLTPARRALLTALAVRPDITVGLISGRRLADLRERTTLPANVYHAGLHGLELAIEERRWQHPELRESRDVVAELVARIRARVGDVPGCASRRRASRSPSTCAALIPPSATPCSPARRRAPTPGSTPAS
jgi:trehalose-phosphatase